MDYNEELKHYGILGMRWGVRRFQNQNGSLTDEGRARYGKKKSLSEKAKERKEAKQRKKSLAKARATRAYNKMMEKKKAKYLEDPIKLNKHSDMFTTQELNDAYAKLMVKENIANLSANKINRGVKYLSNAHALMSSGIELYNDFSAVANFFTEGAGLDNQYRTIYRPGSSNQGIRTKKRSEGTDTADEKDDDKDKKK